MTGTLSQDARVLQAGRRSCASPRASLGGASSPPAPALLFFQPGGIPTSSSWPWAGHLGVRTPSPVQFAEAQVGKAELVSVRMRNKQSCIAVCPGTSHALQYRYILNELESFCSVNFSYDETVFKGIFLVCLKTLVPGNRKGKHWSCVTSSLACRTVLCSVN